jgi:hypothetical protein
VIGWLVVLKVAVARVAWPAASVPVPRLVAPSMNVTVPVGLLGPLPVTVAVKVTVCPDTDGLAEDASTVVVGAALTVCVIAPLLAR